MGNIEPKFQRSFESGVVTNVNPNVAPVNSASLAINFDFDEEIGSAVSRLGTGIVGSQLVDNNTVLGLHNFRDTSGSNHALLAAINASGGATSVVYKVGTGTIVTGLTASLKMRFLTYLDSALMVNGTDAPRSYDGSTVITTGGAFDLANIPLSEPSLCEEFLDRVYLAKAGDDTLYYSSVPTAGAVSWTSGNGSVEIEPEDGGGGFTGLSKVPGYLLIFKERSMKRWNFSSAFPESLVDIGTPSQESVVKGHGLCAFFSASSKEARGFYVTNGGRPQPISHDRARNIKKWIDAIPQANETDVAGWATERGFAWSIGDVTVDGETYNNVVLRWNRVLDQWSIRTYPQRFSCFSSYVDSGTNKIVAGDDDGQVIEIDKADTYTDYNGQPIHLKLLTQETKLGYNQQKTIDERVYWDVEGNPGMHSVVIADGKRHNISGKNNPLTRLIAFLVGNSIKARRFKFGLEGTVQGGRVTVRELEVPNIAANPSYD